MDKLSAMLTFVKVVEAGSFTRAATALCLPKARVSQRVSDLEQVLGVRLLHRTTRTLNLTEDGRAYFEKCQSILGEIDELEGALRGGARLPVGKIRVEILSSIARWIIAPRLREFQEKFPGISIRLGSSDRISNMLEEGVDCAIRGGSLNDSTLVAKHVCSVRLGLYAAPNYLGCRPAICHPDDLLKTERIGWFSTGRGTGLVWNLFSAQDEARLRDAEHLLFDDPDAAIAACIAGAGVCPGAPFAVETYVERGLLHPVLPDWHFAPRPIHIIYPTSKHLSARVRSFVDWSFDVLKTSRSLRLTPNDLATCFFPRAPYD